MKVLSRSNGAAAASAESDSTGDEAEAPTILIVDDRPANLLALDAVLAPLGHRVVQASSGREALKHLLDGDFALILLDVQMPGLDGFETASLIQAHSRTVRIPIIFITATGREIEQVFKGYSHGAVDYLLKPIDADVLRSKVTVFVELYRKGEWIRSQEAVLRRREREHLEQTSARILAESEERYRSLVLASASIVWTCDPRGRIVTDSPSWIAFTGQSALEHRGLGWLDAVHAEDRDDAGRQWLASVATRGPCTLEFRVRRRGGGHAFMSVRAVPVFDADGSIREWVGAGTDVSDRKAAERAREEIYARERQAREAAQEAVRLRDDFLSIASHELNTPLTPLKLQVGMLRRAGDPAATAARVDAIERQIDRMGELVARLLDVSRMAAGRFALEPVVIDLAPILHEVVARFAPEAASQGCEVTLRAEEGAVGNFDRVRTEQVIANMLSNALKYGQGKPVAITLDVAGDAARIRVRDQGIGIAPEAMGRIFERFERAVPPGHYGGFGLGLWIVRQIVEASGGHVSVESTPGQGSTFSLDLPLHKGAS